MFVCDYGKTTPITMPEFYTNRASGVYIFIYMCSIKCKTAVRILLKIDRYDIQVSESNLPMSSLSTLHCSSVVTERSPKKAHPWLPFYFHQRERIASHKLSHPRDINAF